jgi:hypothetical protein
VLHTVFRHYGRTIAYANGSARVLSPEAYARLRAHRPIGDERLESGDSQLHIDRSHPVYFDHPSDHVPGLVLVDEALRAGRAAGHSGWRFESISASFRSFVEIDAQAALKTIFDSQLAHNSHRTITRIVQFGKPAAEVTAQFRFRDDRGSLNQ